MSHSAKIIIIRSTCFENDTRVQRRIEDFNLNGISCEVWSWDRRSKNRQISTRTVSQTQFMGNKVISFSNGATHGKGLKNIISICEWFVFISKNIRNSLDAAIFYACDLDTLIPLFMFGKKKQIFAYDQFDPYSARVKNRFAKIIFNGIEKMLANRVEVLILPSRNRTNFFKKESLIIPNYPSRTWEMNALKVVDKEFNRTILYIGSLVHGRNLHLIFDIAEENKNWSFVIGGEGPLRDFLELESKEHFNIKFLPAQNRSQIQNLYRNADITFACYELTDSNNINTASNKYAESLIFLNPIITNSGTSLAFEIERDKTGFVFDPKSIRSISCFLKEFEDINVRRALWRSMELARERPILEQTKDLISLFHIFKEKHV
jgi:glycosyltransferase involved in cell wall biosynthesis